MQVVSVEAPFVWSHVHYLAENRTTPLNLLSILVATSSWMDFGQRMRNYIHQHRPIEHFGWCSVHFQTKKFPQHWPWVHNVGKSWCADVVSQTLCQTNLHCGKKSSNYIHIDSYYCKPGGRFKNTYELLNLRALKFSYMNKIHIFQCMDKIFCVEFQRYPLKFHTKYLTHTLKDMIFMQFWNFKSS